MGPWIHGSIHMDPRTMDPYGYGSTDPYVYGSMKGSMHGYMERSIWIHGSIWIGPWIHGSMDRTMVQCLHWPTWIDPWFMDPWTHMGRSMEPWIHGSIHMDAWIHMDRAMAPVTTPLIGVFLRCHFVLVFVDLFILSDCVGFCRSLSNLV